MPLLENSIINGKYIVGVKIGAGSFGQVYTCRQIQSKQLYALKMEHEEIKIPQLSNEIKVLKKLGKIQGFPTFHWSSSQGRSNLMVTDFLGPSLEDLFIACGRKFTMKTVLMLADQIIHKIEILHQKDYLHRDIKPENFLMGLHQKGGIVHLIDFGLSRRYRDSKSHTHLQYKQNRQLTGTVRYSSINAHYGIQQSRRDDLEAIGYMLLYFLNGSLPWQGIKANTKSEKFDKIMEKKVSMPVEALFKGLPVEFTTYMNYCRMLQFEEKPDYNFLRKLFRDLMNKLNYENNLEYDWALKNTIESLSMKNHLKLELYPITSPLNNLIQNLAKQIITPTVTQPSKQQERVSFQESVDEDQILIGYESGQENIPDDFMDEYAENTVNRHSGLEKQKMYLDFD